MNATNPCVQQVSDQRLAWMVEAGVAVSDVEWLATLKTRQAVHSAATRTRVETIYTQALTGILASPTPLALLKHAALIEQRPIAGVHRDG